MNGMDKDNAKEKEKEKEKEALRLKIRTEARALSQEAFLYAGQKIAQNLAQLPEMKEARTIFCFVSTPLEPDTHGLIESLLHAGKTVAVPRCKKEGVMEAYLIHQLSELRQGRYGILEPSEDAVCLSPEQIDLALTPALACGRDGSRLGQGGGYYDRYLMRTKALRLALCRNACLFSALPAAPHDCRMDTIVTEAEILRINN